MIDLSVVVSVYNEEESLPSFYAVLSDELAKLPVTAEIIFVNDGSRDGSLSILKSFLEQDARVIIVDFSKNFGHEAAMIAGIDKSRGESVVCMDADLQHPPHYIAEMLCKRSEGFDIVNMVRNSRADAGFLKRWTSSFFYWMTNRIIHEKLEPNASDFFMISKRIAAVLKTDYRERTRFLRGFIQIMGFKKTQIQFDAPKRIAGESKYSLFKLIVLSFSAVSALSKAPLKIALWSSALFGLFSLIVIVYSLIMWIVDTPVSGYTTIVILISAMFSVNLLVIGIIGEYIGFLFDEVKKRPIYTVMEEYE
ncbi:glycosyltransferase family 2 protein [Bacteroidales bacterium OttesenSCG-928-B11]|nr:glycosyltransferase family 2 protein [Bacteroidales bacterium OttesenSCG-928-E04]MDL2308138.1 glycosyltransferase family 2 protein [Bacteroidales bacterium OttesenSCG-928-C03]MDL2311507.1 glycosyltransferase family 2 protein [Bacteroidales bacterium OttesenSCG-928-B11]MDL2325564.1 glycosyltransferase family 2 protein [Bacteroidales bacterium OttesenSCG-928-A14]